VEDPESDDSTEHPNYKSWPTRPNASHRIFKPRNLEYPLYRREPKGEPVLQGDGRTVLIPEVLATLQ
jgi:hypothetical protein